METKVKMTTGSFWKLAFLSNEFGVDMDILLSRVVRPDEAIDRAFELHQMVKQDDIRD